MDNTSAKIAIVPKPHMMMLFTVTPFLDCHWYENSPEGLARNWSSIYLLNHYCNFCTQDKC